jgi:hypothetical protein
MAGFRDYLFPFWSPALVSALLAVLLTKSVRFSLRGLLITTTLLAVVLGLAVYTV